MASAIRCVSSRFLTAVPRLFDASMSSPESRSSMVCSERERELPMSQRMASAWPRSGRTSTGHLVCGAADAARAHFDRRAHVVDGVAEGAQRILARALGHALERAVDDRLRDRFLALVHEAVHELGDDGIAELRIRQNLAFDGGTAARHRSLPISGAWRRISSGAAGGP